MTRRSYGTGSLYVRTDRQGRGTWYGHWRANGRQVKFARGSNLGSNLSESQRT